MQAERMPLLFQIVAKKGGLPSSSHCCFPKASGATARSLKNYRGWSRRGGIPLPEFMKSLLCSFLQKLEKSEKFSLS